MVFLRAEVASDITSKINQNNSDITKLEAEIAQYQSQLDNIGKQKSSLSGSIKELDLTRKKLEADILVTQKKIEKTNFTIKGLSSQIVDKEGLISNDKKTIIAGIKSTNEYELENSVGTILSNESFTSVWNDIDNMVSLREDIRGRIINLKQVKGQLEDTRKTTVSAKNELLSLNKELADQKKIIVNNTDEKKKLLNLTKNSEANYQKLLKDRLAKKDALEKEVASYESQLKFNINQSTLPGKGVLSWPLSYIYITSPFGTRWGAFHAGVDFRASVGTQVMAMADGVISGSGNTDLTCAGASFGKFILIKYDNGLASTYGHLSLISVSSGQRVKRGEVVGYSGNTGYSTGPHLHVSVYPKDAVDVKSLPSKACVGKTLTQPIAATAAYLDPMIYLPTK
ncbi:MAG: peptidoglycan DD-metalloendopeptidase family protein [bacterium]